MFARLRDAGLSRQAYEELKRRGVLVRHFATEKLADGLRISVGTDAEVDTLREELRAFWRADPGQPGPGQNAGRRLLPARSVRGLRPAPIFARLRLPLHFRHAKFGPPDVLAEAASVQHPSHFRLSRPAPRVAA